ncbi:MAG: HNH endonuclease signature motif containing protein [Dethiosulfovibrio sp.]|nr:HNH endonuclease signature motif containing protein [Dethiosulfovibrio sp.]
MLNNFAAAEQGKVLLKKERDSILENIKSSIPTSIYVHNKERLIREIGFKDIDFSDLYFPTYTFQYVSAGGNSSVKSDIRLNIENLDKLVDYLSNLIELRKSIEGQRALMTTKLREMIKTRDNYSCQKCGLSIRDEPNLLLEIDHIIPLSKGGITSEKNLQTLCWKCNRSKGSRIC